MLMTSFTEYSYCCNSVPVPFISPETELVISDTTYRFCFSFNMLRQYSCQYFAALPTRLIVIKSLHSMVRVRVREVEHHTPSISLSQVQGQ